MAFVEDLERTVLTMKEFKMLQWTDTIKKIQMAIPDFCIYFKPEEKQYPISILDGDVIRCLRNTNGERFEIIRVCVDDEYTSVIPVFKVGKTDLQDGENITLYDSEWEYQQGFLFPIGENIPIIQCPFWSGYDETTYKWEDSCPYKVINEYFDITCNKALQRKKEKKKKKRKNI